MESKKKKNSVGFQGVSNQQRLSYIKSTNDPQGHEPTVDTFSDVSHSDALNYDPNAVKVQIADTRFSRTDLLNSIKNWGWKTGYAIIIFVFAGALKFIYNHDVLLSVHNEQIKTNAEKINKVEENVKENTKDINTLKSDKKLDKYRLDKLEEKKK